MKRIGVLGIVVEGNNDISLRIQQLLHEHSDVIIGRMGVPVKEHSLYVISLIISGTVEQVSSLTGALGRIDGITVKSALTNVENN